MKNLLITGASGFLGWNLIRAAKSDWTIFGTYSSHPVTIPDISLIKSDLTNFKDLKRLFDHTKLDAVIHTAAISNPNFCQENRSDTHKINTKAPINIASFCSDLKIPCLFTSSDLVFDGLNPPYTEDDEPSPINAYGEQKALAEEGIKERYPATVICRMPLMFGDPGPVATSFIQPLIKALKSIDEVNLFVDEYRTPLSGRNAAEGLMLAFKNMPPIIHLGGHEKISRFDFGRLLADVFGIRKAKLKQCKQKDMDMPAPRPPDVSFDISKAKALGFQPNPLREELKYLMGV